MTSRLAEEIGPLAEKRGLRLIHVPTQLHVRSDPGLLTPNLQPTLIEFPLVTPELADRGVPENAYCIAAGLVRPASRGSITLTSSDSDVTPAIDMGYLNQEADAVALLAAIELSRDIGASKAFDDLRKREIMPGPLSRADMLKFIRMSTTTFFHPTSSCRMGIDEEAVVDPELRVRGIEGLRIADASIMPEITTGNTNATCVFIGEQAGRFIRS